MTNDKYSYDVILKKRMADGSISTSDSKLITSYIIDKLANGDIVDHTASKIATQLSQFRRFVAVDYQDLTLEKFKLALLKMKNGTSLKTEKQYSKSTQRGMIKAGSSVFLF